MAEVIISTGIARWWSFPFICTHNLIQASAVQRMLPFCVLECEIQYFFKEFLDKWNTLGALFVRPEAS